MFQKLYVYNFIKASIITLIGALVLFYFSFSLGKQQFFLLLNHNLGKTADYFFKFYTHLGDGTIWALLLFIFIKYKKRYLPFLISAFGFCTIIVQICKYFILPYEPRPFAAIQPSSLIHTVYGVEPYTISTFPSGHTAAAFCFFFIACLFFKNKWIIPIGFFYAILVGYSRVYLAQHFPLDVAAGMVTAIIAIGVSIAIQNAIAKKKM
jgi:membrane-associated phospholipid phosphatase